MQRAYQAEPDAELPQASSSYGYSSLDRHQCAEADLAGEAALALSYNGINQAVMLVSPQHLKDFVLGFSFSEGIIESINDIYDLELSATQGGWKAEITLSSRRLFALKQRRRQLSGRSGCGLCGIEALDAALAPLPALTPAALPPIEHLQGLRASLPHWQPLGQHCGAVHAALWMDASGQIQASREDIGRHNALDKLIGTLLQTGQPQPSGCLILTSRCSLELVQKAIRAGFTTLISLSAPTSLAVDQARRYGLNLIHIPAQAGPRVYHAAQG